MLIMADKQGNRLVEVFDTSYDKMVRHIAMNLRKKDFDEVYATTGESPHLAIDTGWILSSRKWIILNKQGKGVAIMGVVTYETLSDIGIPWLLGTKGLDKIKRFFLKICKPVIEEMKKGFEMLVNFVDARYEKAVRWLDWCGFTIDDVVPYGTFDLPFHRFYMECN